MAQQRWSGQVVKGCISSFSSSLSSSFSFSSSSSSFSSSSSSSVLSTAKAQPSLGLALTMALLFSPYRASMALAMYFPTVCSSTSNSNCQTLSCPFCDPCRVLWNTVKHNSTLYPLYPDIVTVQKSLKSTEAVNKYTVFWKVISHCMWNTSEALKGETAKWISLEKVHQVNLKINLVHLAQICNVGFYQSF